MAEANMDLVGKAVTAFNFDEFNTILQSSVRTKRVGEGGLETSFDYQKAYNDPKTAELIKKQKEKLQAFKVETLKDKKEAIAFWMNSYNFFMVTTILEQGFKNKKLNINSVKDFGSLFNPYKIFKKEIHNIGGKNLSLDYMEKTVLLGKEYKKKGWKDARIHFAVNCASVGCPPLLDSVYKAKTLDAILDSNIKQAFKTPRHLSIKGKTLHLTSLFKWYKSDFEEDAGSVKSFIKKFVSPETYKLVEATKDIDHIDYDWNLNKPENFK